jgi:hypothetical protein
VTRTELAAWCAAQAASFRNTEHTITYRPGVDRDTALVEWTLGCLGDTDRDGSGDALEHIDRLRAVSRMEANL